MRKETVQKGASENERNVAKHPTVHKTISTTNINNYLYSNSSSAAVEEHCVILSQRKQVQKYHLHYYTSSSRSVATHGKKEKIKAGFTSLKDEAGIYWEGNEESSWGKENVLCSQIKTNVDLGYRDFG